MAVGANVSITVTVVRQVAVLLEASVTTTFTVRCPILSQSYIIVLLPPAKLVTILVQLSLVAGNASTLLGVIATVPEADK